MTIKKTILFSVVCCIMLIVPEVHAQIGDLMMVNADNLKKSQSRTVYVEIKEEDPKMIAYLSKKEKYADRLKNYKSFISSNNEMLKKAVDKYWKFNATIEYKTTTELNEIRGKKKDNIYYQIIYCATLISGNANSTFDMPGIPALCYDDSKLKPFMGGVQPHDYTMYLPVSSVPDKEYNPFMWTYVQADYDFAIIEMQANFNYIISTDKKFTFSDYADKMAQNNCSKIKNDTLLISKSQLGDKVEETDIKDNYKGPFTLTDDQTYNNTFVNRDKGKEVIFSMAFGLGNGIGGNITMFAKVVVDCNTGEIMYFYKPNSIGVVWYMFDIRKQVFGYMEKCN